MKKPCISALLVLLLSLVCTNALAGSDFVIVAAEGDGATVYTSSSGSKKAGILYNGFSEHIALEPTNGRYECWLTSDYTVWIDVKKAEALLPCSRW